MFSGGQKGYIWNKCAHFFKNFTIRQGLPFSTIGSFLKICNLHCKKKKPYFQLPKTTIFEVQVITVVNEKIVYV